jgi:glycosyltransferase involved in cell wall biosynthesis
MGKFVYFFLQILTKESFMSKKISIIIPVWNGAKYLAETIECALGQDYENKEVIVVNDGSPDRSQEVIMQFGDRIRSFYQENKGLGAARNAGVKRATGEYLAFLDQDDLWISHKLSLQIKEMLTSLDDPLVFSYAEQFICPTLSEEEKKKITISQPILPGFLAGTLLVSRNRFEQVGEFFEEKKIGEFMDWYSRALALKIPVKLIAEVAFRRRIHLSNMGRQKELFSCQDYLKVLKANLDRQRASL